MATMRGRGCVHWVGYAWRRWWIFGERRVESLCGLVELPLASPAVSATGTSREVSCIACRRELADLADAQAGEMWVLLDEDNEPVRPLDVVTRRHSSGPGLMVFMSYSAAADAAGDLSAEHEWLGRVRPVQLREWLRARVEA